MDRIAQKIPAIHVINVNVVGVEPCHRPGIDRVKPEAAILKAPRRALEISAVHAEGMRTAETGTKAVVRDTPVAPRGLCPVAGLLLLRRLALLLRRLALLLRRLGLLLRVLRLLRLNVWCRLGLLLLSVLLLLSWLGLRSGFGFLLLSALLLLSWLGLLRRFGLLLSALLLYWFGLLLWLFLFLAFFLGADKRDGKQNQHCST